MRTNTLVALGCAFWVLPLAGAVSLVTTYGLYDAESGYNYELMPLFAIPVCMIALTVTLGWFVTKDRLSMFGVVVSSLIAVVGCLYWLAVWGNGV